MDQAYAEIAETLTNYFDGFYESDADKLKQIFHPSCHLYYAPDGALQDDGMETVYERVRGRTAPKVTGQPRMDKILSIDQSGAGSALAKVRIAIGDRLFTDYLSLLKIDGRWQIIAKSFSWVLLAEAARQAAE